MQVRKEAKRAPFVGAWKYEIHNPLGGGNAVRFDVGGFNGCASGVGDADAVVCADLPIDYQVFRVVETGRQVTRSTCEGILPFIRPKVEGAFPMVLSNGGVLRGPFGPSLGRVRQSANVQTGIVQTGSINWNRVHCHVTTVERGRLFVGRLR